MSLDEKIINPLAPAEPPSQSSDLLSKSGKKRRKGEGGSSRKAKKVEEDADDSADVTAVLTMGEAPRKQPKKMLFEPDADAGPVSLTTPIARKDNGSTRAALSGTAAVMPAPVPTPAAVPPAPKAMAPEPTPATPAPVVSARPEPQPPAAATAPAAEPHPIADMKGAVFQVATLVMREPDPAPSPEAPAESSQAQLDLDAPVDADIEQSVAAAADDVAPSTPETAAEAPVDAQAELALSEMDTVVAPSAETSSFAESVDGDVTPAEEPVDSPATADVIEPATLDEPAAAPVAEPVAQPAPTPVRPVLVAAQPKAPESTVEPETPVRLSRSEMIARSARMSALSNSRPNGAASAPALRPVPPAPSPQQRPTELPKHAGDLYGYWTRVKNGRRFPSRADFDVEQMAENFPNSMLLTCGANGGSQVNFSSILRLGANRRSQPGEALSFTSMITEWILAIGGEAARAGTPVQDTEVFPAPDGTFAYKIVALPLSDQQTRVEHVLCHLSRS
jgi:hypothetical protein